MLKREVLLTNDFLDGKKEVIQTAINNGIKSGLEFCENRDSEMLAASLKIISLDDINDEIWNQIRSNATKNITVPCDWFIRQAHTITYCMIVSAKTAKSGTSSIS